VALVLLDRVAHMVEHHADMELNVLLAEARSVVNDAIERTRRLAFELWPTVLYEHGLSAAITPTVEQTGREIGAQVRTIQEAIANIRKHSRESQIIVYVRLVGNRLVSVIDDDGRGFNVSTPQNQLKRNTAHGPCRHAGAGANVRRHDPYRFVTWQRNQGDVSGAILSTRHTVGAGTFRSGRLCLR
jgi:signal transduction histidine kinase